MEYIPPYSQTARARGLPHPGCVTQKAAYMFCLLGLNGFTGRGYQEPHALQALTLRIAKSSIFMEMIEWPAVVSYLQRAIFTGDRAQQGAIYAFIGNRTTLREQRQPLHCTLVIAVAALTTLRIIRKQIE